MCHLKCTYSHTTSPRYIGSRIYLHNPPGDGNSLAPPPNATEAEKRKEAEVEQEQPLIGPWFGVAMLIVTVALIAVTAEWLVSSIELVRDRGTISPEWFGLVLLPLLSFAADGLIAVMYFLRTVLLLRPESPDELAKARSIDLSIQFVLFWMPVMVLLGWWTHREMSLLFGKSFYCFGVCCMLIELDQICGRWQS
jgi:Ca2+:H+ antiporter